MIETAYCTSKTNPIKINLHREVPTKNIRKGYYSFINTKLKLTVYD